MPVSWIRLLCYNDDGNLCFREPSDESDPPYAILSHTWLPRNDDDEVLYTDILNGSGRDKAGWRKLQHCADQAKKDGYKHFWIDTCCINKRVETELNKSITSMYQYYSNSAKCYVYLEDASSRKRDSSGVLKTVSKTDLERCRWFTRGWNLQELLGPKQVEFYSRSWDLLGTKHDMTGIISSITGICNEALLCMDASRYPPRVIRGWAKHRETKEPEDAAYSLVSIFGISLVSIYGEGKEAALNRLYDEIGKQTRLDLEKAEWTAQQETVTQPVAQGRYTQQQILDALKYEEMDDRKANITNCLRRTCEWLTSLPAWSQWMDVSSSNTAGGLLWIKGNPGAGKSTLMKFADGYLGKHRPSGSIQIAYYFNARGTRLQKTVVGMYRALIFQLIMAASHAAYNFPERDVSAIVNGTLDDEELTRVLGRVFLEVVNLVLTKHKLYILVDALDECDEDDIKNLLTLFHDSALDAEEEGHFMRVCVASRHYPVISPPTGTIEIILEDETGHAADLEKFVTRRLSIGRSRASEIELKILKKANGIFIWVVLVIPALNDIYARGGRIAEVEAHLQQAPRELNELFRQILERDHQRRNELLLCLQWVLFAQRPLSPQEFYIAMECGSQASEYALKLWDTQEVDDDAMTRRLRDCSKGLAELTKSKKAPTVQFIHESVRQFLLGDHGIQELWPDLSMNMVAASHDELKKCCRRYLDIDLATVRALPIDRDGQRTAVEQRNKLLDEAFPLLRYAIENVLHHAEEAAQSVDQRVFLETFPVNQWVSLHRIQEKYQRRRLELNASLLYLLRDRHHLQLFRVAWLAGLGPRPTDHLTPRFDRPANSSLMKKTCRKALEFVLLILNGQHKSDLVLPQNVLSRCMKATTSFSITFEDMLLMLADCSEGSDLVSSCLEHSDLCFAEDGLIYYLVCCSCIFWGQESAVLDSFRNSSIAQSMSSPVQGVIVSKLAGLVREVCAELSSTNHLPDKLWLRVAVYAMSRAITLTNYRYYTTRAQDWAEDVSKGIADAMHENCDVLTRYVLELAIQADNAAAVQRIINRGVDIQRLEAACELTVTNHISLGGEQRTSLKFACLHGRENVVYYLIKQGACVNSVYHNGVTPLILAVQHDREDTVRTLLRSGADTSIRDDLGRTALHYACMAQTLNSPFLSALLDKGARPGILDNSGQSALDVHCQIKRHELSSADCFIMFLAKHFTGNMPSWMDDYVQAIRSYKPNIDKYLLIPLKWYEVRPLGTMHEVHEYLDTLNSLGAFRDGAEPTFESIPDVGDAYPSCIVYAARWFAKQRVSRELGHRDPCDVIKTAATQGALDGIQALVDLKISFDPQELLTLYMNGEGPKKRADGVDTLRKILDLGLEPIWPLSS